MRTITTSRARALRAAHAVTLGSAVVFVAACGTTTNEGADDTGSTTDTTGGDVSLDVSDTTVSTDAADDTAAPDMTLPDGGAPDAIEPDAIEPDAVEPDAIEPDVVQPDVDVSDITEPDVTESDVTESDVVEPDADAGTDVSSDVEDPGCKESTDGVCPADCTEQNDYDCCMLSGAPGLCVFDPEWGCSCAVEGPFAPPSLPSTGRSVRKLPGELR